MPYIFLGGLVVEINTFNPKPTTIQDFRDCYFCLDGKDGYGEHYWGRPLKLWSAKLKELNWDYMPGFCAGAMPAGRVKQSDYEQLKSMLLDPLKKAHEERPFEAILLHLHGSMISEKIDDCEGDILESVRKIVGPDVFIGAVFDPHTNLTETMMSHADVLVWLKEYPHIDIESASEQLFSILQQTLSGELKPTMAKADTHVINLFPTMLEESPIKGFVAEMRELEEDPDIAGVFLAHGFPWADVTDNDAKVLVIANNNQDKAQKLATGLAEKIYAARGKTLPTFYSVEDALVQAKQHKQNNMTPTVLSDFADNVGGGAIGDSTFILQALLDQRDMHWALATLWDPEVVDEAFSKSEGDMVNVTLGGKNGGCSGEPVDLEAKIIKKVKNLSVIFADSQMGYGDAVALDISGNVIIVNKIRCQAYSTECFTNMGIDPTAFDVLVVKSSEHYRQSFSEISENLLTVSTPGAMTIDFKKIPYQKVRAGVWPVTNRDANRLSIVKGIFEEKSSENEDDFASKLGLKK